MAPSGTYDPQSSDCPHRSANLTRVAAWEDDETDLTRRSCNSFVRVAGRPNGPGPQVERVFAPESLDVDGRAEWPLDDGGLEAILRIATSAHSRHVCALRHWMWCRGGCECGLWSLGRILFWFLSRGLGSVVRWWLYSSESKSLFQAYCETNLRQ